MGPLKVSIPSKRTYAKNAGQRSNWHETLWQGPYISWDGNSANGRYKHGRRSGEHNIGRQISKPHRPLVVLAVPLRTQTLHGSMDMFAQIKLVYSVFDVLQNLRLFGQLLRPIRVQVEAKRVQV